MTDAGWLGVWLLAFSAAAIVVEGIVAAAWTMRLVRHAKLASARIEEAQGLIEGDLARLRTVVAETQQLWRPYARALRFLNHPLVIALFGSYRARWAAR